MMASGTAKGESMLQIKLFAALLLIDGVLVLCGAGGWRVQGWSALEILHFAACVVAYIGVLVMWGKTGFSPSPLNRSRVMAWSYFCIANLIAAQLSSVLAR